MGWCGGCHGQEGRLHAEPVLISDIANLSEGTVREGELVRSFHVGLPCATSVSLSLDDDAVVCLKVVLEVAQIVRDIALAQDLDNWLLLELLLRFDKLLLLELTRLTEPLRRCRGTRQEGGYNKDIHVVLVVW